MTRRCSHCSNNGHNSRTCPTRSGVGGGLRLFGVRLTQGVGAMKKSASMSCLSSMATAAAAAIAAAGALASVDPLGDGVSEAHASGYASDDPAHASCSSSRSERKKGVPWTEEEHRLFLLGLQKLGKGDWRGIAKKYVVSRTPTQVASHAQKYFIRHSNASRRKRRSSLFDMVPEMPIDQVPEHEELCILQSPPKEETANDLPTLNLGQHAPEVAELSKPNQATEFRETFSYNNTQMTMVPTFYPAFIPVPLPFWSSNLNTTMKHEEMRDTYEIFKPIPVVQMEPVYVNDVVMSKLSIGEGSASCIDPSALSLKLISSTSSRQSAFHINPSITGPDLNQSNGSPIHAV